MKAGHGLRAGLTLICALSLMLGGTVAAVAEVTPGYKKGEVVLVSEKNEVATNAVAVRGGQILTSDVLDWEDGGIHGQALHLNGAGDYIEYPNKELCAGEITVAGWICWLGGVTDNPDSELNQQLFTVFRDAENYFTLNLHAYRDNVREAENGTVYRMDGVSLEYKVEGSDGTHIEAYNLTSGAVDYAIRKNEWTHLAITISKHAIKLYINGVHWFEEHLDDACYILDANGVRIGGTVGDSPYTLSALVDDVAVFQGILDGEIIAYLADGAGLDFSAPAAATEADETEPTSTSTAAHDGAFQDTENGGFFADITIPTFTWYVLGGLLLLMIVLTIALNRHEAKRREEEKE